ncbi:hypothetical protein [Bacillus thuringiensis]|uniref:hypothetical protein n=1 Tax=Bacillus thuringiensis TaxID=1428 RepID=UPI000D5833F2|nr:hypothetical protein [Bacillus thuringiensis]MBD8075732.1 hypothetical protein [Bacillus thuringiensis]
MLIGLLFGTSLGLILSVGIEKLIDYGFEKERQQMNMKITEVNWLSKKDEV